MAPGLSPAGRLRSKTSDLSDLLRGNQRSNPPDSLAPIVPAVSPSDGLTPSKSRRKLADFLNRKRKSSGVTAETTPRHSENHDVEATGAPSQSRIPTASSSLNPSSSLPSSLPPLNVSPPSFGSAFQSSTPPRDSRLSTATTESSSSQPSRLSRMPSLAAERSSASSSQSRLKALRPQKSSFEVSSPFNFTHHATASNMAMLNSTKGKAPTEKPTITVSGPPANQADDNSSTYSSPRSAPTPPSSTTKSRSSKESRKPLSFGFSHQSKKAEAPKRERTSTTPAPAEPSQTRDKTPPTSRAASSTSSASPPLPPKMHFPVPPSSKLKQPSTSAIPASKPSRERFPSQSTTKSSASAGRAATSDLSESELSPSSSRSVPVKPARPVSLVIPAEAEGRPRSNSANTVKLDSTPSSPASSSKLPAGSIRLRANRVSRTINPASPPPVTPLPSPPTSASFPTSSDAEGWSTDASTRLGGWSTDNSTRIGSLASRKSAASLEAARARTTTMIAMPSRSAAGGVSSGGEESDRSRIRQFTRSTSSSPRGGDLAQCLPSFSLHGRQHERDKPPEPDRPPDKPRQRALSERARPQALQPPSQEQARRSEEGSSGSQGTPTPTKEDMRSQSLRAAHETYVRILQEKHAAEKAELIRRIERLERESKKREREIKGLRWLVLNATSEDGTMSGAQALLALDEKLSGGRYRSGSRSSEWSGSVRSRTSSGQKGHIEQSPSNFTDGGSTEDGLIELQQEVSDLIAPWESYSPRTSETQGERSGSPGSSPGLQRSRTMPESEAAAIKQARRSSSPVLPAIPSIPQGLGFDMPESSSDSSVSQSSSVPSMTTSSTLSSSASSHKHLSMIPEQPTPTESLFAADVNAQGSSPSPPTASTSSHSYTHNVKLGMSPSIGQVLDHGRTAEEAGMEDVLRKLRAFSP